ncbi:MAG: GNAT family N-acetyltransferase [Lentisphaeria bacterium]|jgi:GNAT superfamily N-acetyltransferase|nr:GNAT family N-acetyltransferase [Lentisphaeria bacterium]
MKLTRNMILENPGCISRDVTMACGTGVVLRALGHNDAAVLGRFFEGLSAATRRVFRPHPFTGEHALSLCTTIADDEYLRLVGAGQGGEVVAYLMFLPGIDDHGGKRYAMHGMPLDGATDCAIAPCVADAYQGQGLGRLLMNAVFELARELGCRRITLLGGVQSDNPDGIRFYESLGFKHVGTFGTEFEEYDMIFEL